MHETALQYLPYYCKIVQNTVRFRLPDGDFDGWWSVGASGSAGFGLNCPGSVRAPAGERTSASPENEKVRRNCDTETTGFA